MIKWLAVCLMILSFSYQGYARDFQFNFNVGTDDPSASDTRTQAATLVRFGLSTKPTVFRFNTAFTAITGSGYTQGELALGTSIYFLGSILKAPAQPFFFFEAAFGVGTFANETRMDPGYGMGAGVDLKFFKASGITLAVEQHNATESATRLWIGYFWQ